MFAHLTMSYARMGADGSDVYVYVSQISNGDPVWVCCFCRLMLADNGFDREWFPSEDKMVAHLLEHRAAGHTVPQYAIDRLQREAEDRQTHSHRTGGIAMAQETPEQQDDGAAERLKQIKEANAKADADAKVAAKERDKEAAEAAKHAPGSDTDPELPATPKTHRK